MSKLFELYVLGLLKDRYRNVGTVQYHLTTRGNELNFLLHTKDLQMVVDAKYKLKYNGGNVDQEDIRQVSGYARLKQVYKALGKPESELIDCMIIYPAGEVGDEKDKVVNLTKEQPVGNYVGVYKYGVRLPVV